MLNIHAHPFHRLVVVLSQVVQCLASLQPLQSGLLWNLITSNWKNQVLPVWADTCRRSLQFKISIVFNFNFKVLPALADTRIKESPISNFIFNFNFKVLPALADTRSRSLKFQIVFNFNFKVLPALADTRSRSLQFQISNCL